MSQIDAVGTMATLVAADAMSEAVDRRPCANCGTPLAGPYCGQCGQAVKDRSRPLLRMLAETLEDLVHFDSRVARTVLSLLFLPGRMTADHVEGRRIRYVPPLRLYLFVSLIFFVVLSATNVGLIVVEAKLRPDAVPGAEQSVYLALDENSLWINIAAVNGASVRFLVDLDEWKPELRLRHEDLARSLAEMDITDWQKRLLRGLAMSLDHPESLNAQMGDNLAKLMFVLMPIYAMLLAALYRKRRLYYVDHLVFSLHVHAFLFLILIIAVGIGQIPHLSAALLATTEPVEILLLAVAVYCWVALKRTHRQGVVKTTVKWLLLGGSYLLVLMVGFLCLLAWTLPEL